MCQARIQLDRQPARGRLQQLAAQADRQQAGGGAGLHTHPGLLLRLRL